MSVAVQEDTPEPWERLPGETAKSYAAFVKYREMPTLERSLRGVAISLGRGASVIAGWSRQHAWVARSDAYDEHLDKLALAAQDARVAKLAELRADFAVEALTTVMKRLRGDEDSNVEALDVGKLTAKDIAALAGAAEKVGASMDRLTQGSGDNRDVSVKLSFDLSPQYGAQADVTVHTPVPEEIEDADEVER